MQNRRFHYPVLLLLLLLFAVSCKQNDSNACVEEEKESTFFYGINVDSLEIHRNTIESNAFLASILMEYNVAYSTIHEITEQAKGIFDFRQLRSGQNYYVLNSKDASKRPEYFIYEKSLSEYVICEIGDAVCVYQGEKPVRMEEKVAAGEITSSLYLTLEHNNIHPTLALSLNKIYAWTIDFYHLQEGDRFKVLYKEKFVDSVSLGVTEITAAIFDHKGKEIYATPFKLPGDTAVSFFDQEGESLQKAFLKSPLKFGRISSGFSSSRKHPVTGQTKGHFGTDYAAPHGTPILATANGVVVEATFKKYNGNYVKIKHNGTYMTQYLHMSKFGAGIKPGKSVRQGDVIGYVGSTGLSTGPHVCYRFWKEGKQVNHLKEDLLFREPIPEKDRAQFFNTFDSLKVILDNIPYPQSETLEVKPIAANKTAQ
jgi:murein DD-endopeptidase MepM/ murein hydrolase activator NlpD